MAEDKLVGNIATEELLAFAKESSISLSLDEEAFAIAAAMASSVFI